MPLNAQALVMTPSTVQFSGGSLSTPPWTIYQSITRQQYSVFPAPWTAQSGDPGIKIQVTNNAVTAPVAPILVDAYVDPGVSGTSTYYAIFAELPTVQPGKTVMRVVQGLPVTQMLLVLMYLDIGNADINAPNGFTVGVKAWKV